MGTHCSRPSKLCSSSSQIPSESSAATAGSWVTPQTSARSRGCTVLAIVVIIMISDWKKKPLQQWKITIFNGKIHYKWPFSIAILVHQRVHLYHIKPSSSLHWGVPHGSSLHLRPFLLKRPRSLAVRTMRSLGDAKASCFDAFANFCFDLIGAFDCIL